LAAVFDSLRSTFSRSDVLRSTIGPRMPPPMRAMFCGVFVAANASRALKTSLRKLALRLPFHCCAFGRVMISTWTRPASWLSAANELVRNRIWRMSSRFGSRPPVKPLTRNTAPRPPAISSSMDWSSSGSSGSCSITASSSTFVVSALPVAAAATPSSTTTCSWKPSIFSVTVWLFAPLLSVSGAA
jgi:hypothetical protein